MIDSTDASFRSLRDKLVRRQGSWMFVQGGTGSWSGSLGGLLSCGCYSGPRLIRGRLPWTPQERASLCGGRPRRLGRHRYQKRRSVTNSEADSCRSRPLESQAGYRSDAFTSLVMEVGVFRDRFGTSHRDERDSKVSVLQPPTWCGGWAESPGQMSVQGS